MVFAFVLFFSTFAVEQQVRLDLERLMAASLTPSEALVLRLRFGLEDAQRRSEREVAELMQETRNAIRAKTATAFRKMRALPGARELLESLDELSSN